MRFPGTTPASEAAHLFLQTVLFDLRCQTGKTGYFGQPPSVNKYWHHVILQLDDNNVRAVCPEFTIYGQDTWGEMEKFYPFLHDV